MKRGVVIGIVVGFILLVVLIIALVARSSSPSTGEKTLSVWSPFSERKIYEQISQKFLDDNPGIKLEFRYIDAKDSKDYEAKVVNAIANGNGPDIWLIRNDWLPKHAGKSAPTTWEVVKKVSPIDQLKAVLIPSIVDLNTYQGKLYGVPLAADSLALIYNQDYYTPYYNRATDAQKELLKFIPKTWDELKAQTALTTTVQGSTVQQSGLAVGTKTIFAPSDVLTAFLSQSGAAILSADGKDVNFNIAQYQAGQPFFPATEALTFFTSFATPGQANYSWSASMGDPIDSFMQGKTGGLIGYWSTLQQIVDNKPSFKIIVGALPQKVESKSGERSDYAISWSNVVSSKSANQKLAWDYLGYLVGRDVQSAYAEATNKIPTLGTGSTCDRLDEGSEAASSKIIFSCQLATAVKFEKPEWQLTDEVIQDMISQVTDLKQTPQNSVDSAAERFKVFISP